MAKTFTAVIGTWNSFGVPQDLTSIVTSFAPYSSRLRSRVVRDQLESPDVLVVQELFSHDVRDLFDGLTSFSTRERDRSSATDSTGLGILSRLKRVTRPVIHNFRAMAAGTDAMVKKGAMHLRVALQRGPELDVVTTHMQSGNSPAAVDVRAAQMKELGDFVARHTDPTRALVLLGDLNVEGLRRADQTHGEEYGRLKRALPGLVDLGAFRDLPTVNPKRNAMLRAYDPSAALERVDYVFFRPGAPNRASLSASHFKVMLGDYLSDIPMAQWEDVGSVRPCAPFASDHFGLAVTLRYDAGE